MQKDFKADMRLEQMEWILALMYLSKTHTVHLTRRNVTKLYVAHGS